MGLWMALVLLAASVSTVSRAEYGAYLDATRMFPTGWARVVAGLIALWESLAALLLLWPQSRLIGWLAVAWLAGSLATFHVFSLFLSDVTCYRYFGVQISHSDFTDHCILVAVCLMFFAYATIHVIRHRRCVYAVHGTLNGAEQCASHSV